MRTLLIACMLMLASRAALADCGWNQPSPDCIDGRSLVDRPDEQDAYQIHVIYAIPSDGDDQGIDTDGRIADLIAWGNDWFRRRTSHRLFDEGQTFRFDETLDGDLDITFVRLANNMAYYSRKGAYIRDELEAELYDFGFRAPNKIYAVIFGGRMNGECTGGGGAWPPALPGNVAAIYIGDAACPYVQRLSREYSRVAMIHEIVHTLGFVAKCAPRHTRRGHTTIRPDLMWAGEGRWNWSAVDDGGLAYYSHHNADCPLDLAASAFLEPSVELAQLPPGWQRCGYRGYGRPANDPAC